MGFNREKPEAFKDGVCFLCGNPCEPGHYLHYDCSRAYNDEFEKRIKEVKDES